MTTELIRHGFVFDTDGAPNGYGWLPKLKAAALLNVGERALEKRAKTGQLNKRDGSDGKVEYLVKIPNVDEPNANQYEQEKNETELNDERYDELIRQLAELREKSEETENKTDSLKDENRDLKNEVFKYKNLFENSESRREEIQKDFQEKLSSQKQAYEDKLKEQKSGFEIIIKEKDELIAVLKDQVSQEKEHIQAEKSRADMASNQLMNANALIKRRDDAPAQIFEPNPEIEFLKEKIKELEKAKTPWWKKLNS